jgi:hypothetical protein
MLGPALYINKFIFILLALDEIDGLVFAKGFIALGDI